MQKEIKSRNLSQSMPDNCPDCNKIITENFCSFCGHQKSIERIDAKYAGQEILNLVGYERGFLFTVKNLLIKPAETIKHFLYINRNTVTKPLTFLILSSVIYTLISHYLQTDVVIDQRMKNMLGNSSVYLMNKWIQENYGYANLLMILPIAFFCKLLFRQYQYNFFEVVVIICFVMGEGMLILSVQQIFNYYLNSSLVDNAFYVIVFAYISWAISIVYDKSIKNYFKALSAYLLGMISFQLITTILAVLYDIAIKK
ncbi:DUF3667 domain-containing protein [Runella salmonicolor]|uniref:DUF3667 domain-containing protein n=1 Tax=Runella salmonicolor TaxID=2950278 RepID=A0ABT1FKJ7_9BACT|nr:DUF3667 domain-containing protein [Runella salmonicolor]MCP1382256.1 DUF3667 domain-containing protein [Runella salmonicolor]